MHFVTNLFLVMGVQNVSKSVKICQRHWRKLAAMFLCPTAYIMLEHFYTKFSVFIQHIFIHKSV